MISLVIWQFFYVNFRVQKLGSWTQCRCTLRHQDRLAFSECCILHERKIVEGRKCGNWRNNNGGEAHRWETNTSSVDRVQLSQTTSTKSHEPIQSNAQIAIQVVIHDVFYRMYSLYALTHDKKDNRIHPFMYTRINY